MIKYFLILALFFFSQISFSQGPNATYTVSSQTVCVGETVTFTSTSTPGSNNSQIVKEKWDFGDGSTSGDINGSKNTTTHIFQTAGTYNINFFATDASNLTSSNPQVGGTPLTITVNPLPNNFFTATPTSCTLPVNVTINNNAYDPSYDYNWDFGNGQTSNTGNPNSFTYDNSGNYTITLTATNSSTGCNNTYTKNITINDFQADFNLSSDSICQGTSVTLTDLSTSGVNTWNWNNGNGETSTVQNPTFTYNSSGTYTISLTATNTANSCTDNITKNIIVIPLPNIDVSPSDTAGCSPLAVDFTNNSIDPNTSYLWNFNDGSSNYTGTTPPTHTYSTDGTFNLTITATNNFGCIRSRTYTDLITTSPAIADFNGSKLNGCEPVDVQFNDLSQSSNPTSDPIVSWQWDFGNGNTSNNQTPNIETYNVGKYDVTLTITTQKGCNATVTKQEYIQVGKIDSVGFSYDLDTICAKSSVQFTDLSLITVPYDPNEIIYIWDFGDGGTGTLKDPTWSYPSDTGFFDVSLLVNFRGCIDSFKIDSAVFVWPPISNFSPAQTAYCNPASFPVQVDVSDQAIIGRNGDDVEMIYRWGDQANTNTNYTSASFDPNNDQWSSSFNYSNYGVYTIKQVVYNNTTGCKDSTTQSIAISAVTPNFSISTDSLCIYGNVDLLDQSTSILGNIVKVTYNMGDSTINGIVGGLKSYTYKHSNSFNILITATDEFGCENSTTKNIKVLSLPIADITPSKTGACVLDNIIFNNSSGFTGTTHATSIVQSDWIKPDLSTQTTGGVIETINYTVPNTGQYKTILTVTDDFGCVSLPDTVVVTITKPSPNFAALTTQCNKSTTSIPNLSSGTGILSSVWKVDNVSESTQDDLQHIFNDLYTGSQLATHKITLIVTDGNGCIDSLSRNVSVSIPYADFTPTATGVNQNSAFDFSCPPVYVSFTNNSTSPSSYNWNFGNGNGSIQTNPEATYIQPGLYNASLTITDIYGCQDDTILVDYLFIGGPKATPNITDLGDICHNSFLFTMTDTSEVFKVLWDFDDYTTSDLDSLEHNYPIGGAYQPTLTVYDQNNCSVLYTLNSVNVIGELNAKHSVSPNPSETYQDITFTDLSVFTAPIVTWTWEFGDFDQTFTTLDTNDSPIFGYKFPSTYYTVLTVTDINGCSSSDTIPLKITGDFETPNVFTPNNDLVNDYFHFDVDIFNSYDVLILNRWGNVVFDKKSVTGTAIWFGLDNNGKECTDGVYFFKVIGTLKDNSPFEKSGYVTKITG